MTYKVVQRIGNNYYLYSVEGKWDPEKKNSKQERRYIGPCDKDGNPIPSKRAKRVDPSSPIPSRNVYHSEHTVSEPMTCCIV